VELKENYNITGKREIISQSLTPFSSVYAAYLKEKTEATEAQSFFFGRLKKERFLTEAH